MNLSVIKTETILGMELRVFGDIENPLFLAKDVATWIEHSKVSMMLEIVGGSKGVSSGYVLTKGGKQEMKLLTEKQVYRILMRSDKPIALEIQDGIFEFLKSWRKGEVKVVQEEFKVPTTYKEALLALIEAEEVKERLLLENKEVKEAVVEIKHSLNNLEADVRVNINQAIKRLADCYCKMNKIVGVDRECIYREIYQTVYTGFCKEYNVDFQDIKRREHFSLKTGKPTKTKQSFIKIIESMGYSTMLMEYVIQLKPTELDLVKKIG
ncbi:MAG: BRO-N domain-containing protein [Fusobacteriaceae bacterium]